MLPKKHTEIDILITPVGDEPIEQTFLFKNVVLNTIDDVEEYISFGGDANWILSDAQNISTYGILDNWEITHHELFTDSDLGIRWALENSDRLSQKQQISLEEQWKDLGCNGWLKPNGEFISVFWHIDYVKSYIEDNELDDVYMEEFRNKTSYSPTDFLENRGWVRVQGNRTSDSDYVKNAFFKTINNTQLEKLNLICLKYNKAFKDVVYNSEWLWNLEKNKKI